VSEEAAPAVTKLTIEYVGTRFAGWAIQPGKRTVCAELVRALTVLLGREPWLVVAGRTDAGVHALGQVASYPGEPVKLRSLNALLPDEVGVLAAEPAPPGFNARYDAVSRSYLYRVHTRRPAPSPFERHRALWWPHTCDLDVLQACAAALEGVRDFTAFTPTQTRHRHFNRTVMAASWTRAGDEVLEFRIEADAFLRSMNRVLVATMLEVAGGRRTLEDFRELLEGAPRSRAAATAPAHGLYLTAVRYE
jgi:tRNA pseudouridine38-40 synthase